jgi:alkylated DNA nucleotide flippase Atl1
VAATVAEDSDDCPADDLTPKDKAVLQVIDEMAVGSVLSNDQIAQAAGYANSGKLRTFMKTLAIAGRLKPHRYGWERVK